MDNKNFNFSFSVSEREYNRNIDNAAFIKWIEISGNVNDLSNYIINGFAFCNCFYSDRANFTNSEKTDNNLKSANLLCLDLDAVRFTYSDFCALMEQTEISPNIVYTTANNGKFKNEKEKYNNRYRVIYVLDEPIYNKELYINIHQNLKKEIEIITQDENIFNDNTDKSPSHFFAGNKDCNITVNSNIFNLKWIIERYGISTPNIKSVNHYNNKDKNYIKISNNRKYTYVKDYFYNNLNNIESVNHYNNKKEGESIIKMDDTFSEGENQFIEDYYILPFNELIHKYIKKYPSVECTQMEYDDTEPFIILPNNYAEIKRKWYKEEITKDNGQIVNVSNIRKTKNGEGRKNLLFKNLLIRKKILPNITFCHLLLNAIFEVNYFINNTDQDDKITKQQIAQIAVNAYFSEVRLQTKEKRKMKVNEKYCAKHNISKRVLNMKMINQKEIEDKQKNLELLKTLYNENLKDDENLSILKDNGMNISLSTYKRYKKELGLNKRSYKAVNTKVEELPINNIISA